MINKQLIDACEALGWMVHEDDDGSVELEQYSPAGEDFLFYVCPSDSTFVNEIVAYAADFDPDEHIVMWIEAKHNGGIGIPNARELVHDAEAIDEMLQELAIKLVQVECEIENAKNLSCGL